MLFYLILKKEIHELKYGGLVILGISWFFLFLFFIHFLTADNHTESKAGLLDTEINVKFFTGFPTIISAYAFQTTFFTPFASLKNKTNKNGQLADLYSRVLVFIIYNTVWLLAYGLYGGDVEKDLLKNVSEEDGVLPIILESIFLLVSMMAIPIIFFLGKEAVLIIFDEITRKSYSKQNKELQEHKEKIKGQAAVEVELSEQIPNSSGTPAESNDDEESKQEVIEQPIQKNETGKIVHVEHAPVKLANPKAYLEMNPLYYYIITIVLYVIVITLSITVEDVTIFFGIIGSTTGIFVNWVGPGSFYIIGIHKENYQGLTKFEKFAYVGAWIYVVIGIIAMVGLNLCIILNLVL